MTAPLTYPLTYPMEDGFELVKADYRIFSIHFNTYRENLFFRLTWEKRLAIFNEDDACYWIVHQQQRIGGVCMEPNVMSALFLEPPYSDLHAVASKLKKLMLSISDASKPIYAYAVLPDQIQCFLRLGFLSSEARKAMIRPTEAFGDQDWGTHYTAIIPEKQHLALLADMYYDAYSGSDGIGISGEHTMERIESDLQYYFDHAQTELVVSASTILLDPSSGKAVAACLVSLWEDLPLIYDIAVLPAYRHDGLATKLLKHALGKLHAHFQAMRLFVTVGNPAESIYYNLGFYAGQEQTTMHLPIRRS